MDLNEHAKLYLDAFLQDEEIEGGIAWGERIDRRRLDFSLESLDYLDQTLQGIHRVFLASGLDEANQSLQNLLFATGFYIGATISKLTGQTIRWMSHSEYIAANPKLEGIIPPILSYHLVALLSSGQHFYPLVAPWTILTEGPAGDKSIRYSAQGVLRSATNAAEASASSTPQKGWDLFVVVLDRDDTLTTIKQGFRWRTAFLGPYDVSTNISPILGFALFLAYAFLLLPLLHPTESSGFSLGLRLVVAFGANLALGAAAFRLRILTASLASRPYRLVHSINQEEATLFADRHLRP